MEKFTSSVIAELFNELQSISMQSDDRMRHAQLSFYAAQASLKKVKEYILRYVFKNEEEEIRFFKEIKPSIQKEVLYYKWLYEIEAAKPFGPEQELKDYYSNKINLASDYLNKNRAFYNYYRSGWTQMDSAYFLREKEITADLPIDTTDWDTRFTTAYGMKMAQILAYEQLISYLKTALQKPAIEQLHPPAKSGLGLTWTDPKASLIELLFSIHAKGSINRGNIALKQLVAFAEGWFNISLGNVYTVIMGMGIRKKGRTPYLNNLIGAAEDKMDQRDE